MEFTKITIDNYINAQPFLINEKVCEFGITPTCLYAPVDKGEFTLIDGFVIIKSVENNKTYFSIAGDLKRRDSLKKIIDELKEEYKSITLNFLSKEKAETLKEIYDFRYVKTDPDQYDYLYKITDFASLKGKSARHKREGYKAFVKNNDFYYKEIEKNDKDDCMKIVNSWCERKDCSACEYSCERDLIASLFERWDDFPVKGGIIYINNTPSALLICEILGNTIMGYHQKTISNEIKGLSYAIYIEAMNKSFSQYEYFNFGPDMGLAGLRQFKRQFKPFELVEKYEITI